ncbi:MAG: chloride channel protein [Bacteroidia bacterium]|nr:chloride channel protein [Bacteroidia bacterium]
MIRHILHKMHVWLVLLQKKTSKKNFIFLLAVSSGLCAGFAAVILKTAVHFIFTLATENKYTDSKYILLLLPMLGIFLTYFIIKRILGGKLSKGLSPIHFSIAQKSSDIPSEQTYAQLITSPVTVGLGGSAGLEAPIVITGAALGSNLAKYFRLNYAERTLLLACGVAAGIGAAFNAPIAGVLFTIEVLMLDISTAGFIPLLIASASGALISKIILDEGTLLSFQQQQPFDYSNVPYYIILGGLAGLMSIYHAKLFVKVEKHFSKLKIHPYLRMIYAGLALALMIWLFPTLFGEGYSSIKSLASIHPEDVLKNSLLQNEITNEWLLLFFILIVMGVKAIATGITLGGGGNGGNFAPSLFVGSYLGFIYAKFINLTHIGKVPESNFTLVGMAGVLSGLYHAPLTAIFLIAEITGGYSLMIPLMIVASISYFVSKSIEHYSMDTKELIASRKIHSGNKDESVLVTMKMDKLIETNFVILKSTDNISTLIQAIIASERNIFPVTDQNKKLLGIVLLNDVKNIIFEQEKHVDLQIKDIMKPFPDIIHLTDDMISVVEKFELTDSWNLPVVDKEVYIGFISKSKLFSSYRGELISRTLG